MARTQTDQFDQSVSLWDLLGIYVYSLTICVSDNKMEEQLNLIK